MGQVGCGNPGPKRRAAAVRFFFHGWRREGGCWATFFFRVSGKKLQWPGSFFRTLVRFAMGTRCPRLNRVRACKASRSSNREVSAGPIAKRRGRCWAVSDRHKKEATGGGEKKRVDSKQSERSAVVRPDKKETSASSLSAVVPFSFSCLSPIVPPPRSVLSRRLQTNETKNLHYF